MPNNNDGLIQRVRDCLRSQRFVPDPKKTLRYLELFHTLDQEGLTEEADTLLMHTVHDNFRNYAITELTELGDGIVLVLDNTKEWGVYFDAEQWGARPPYTSEHLELFPGPVKARGLGRFAALNVPYAPKEIAHLTRTRLRPTRRTEGFYDKPVPVKYTDKKSR